MWKQPKTIAFLLLFVTAILQTAAAHSLTHDEDNATHCTICLVAQHAQPALEFDNASINFDSVQHSIFVQEYNFYSYAFAKASTSQSSLSIRPPPHSRDI